MLTLMITLGCTIHFSLFTSQGTSCWFQGASAVSSFKSKVKNLFFTLHLSPFTFNVTPVHAQRILSLQECCELAERNNIKSKDARHAIETADEQKKYAFSKYLPEVNVTGLVFKSNKYLVAKENFSDFIEEIIDAFESSRCCCKCKMLSTNSPMLTKKYNSPRKPLRKQTRISA